MARTNNGKGRSSKKEESEAIENDPQKSSYQKAESGSNKGT